MSRLDDKELARKLATLPSPEPPAGLLERIVEEIPGDLEVSGGAEPAHRRLVDARYLLAAASIVMVVGGGLLAYRVVRQAPLLGEIAPGEGELDAQAAPAEKIARTPVDDLAAVGEPAPAEALEMRIDEGRGSRSDGIVDTAADQAGMPAPDPTRKLFGRADRLRASADAAPSAPPHAVSPVGPETTTSAAAPPSGRRQALEEADSASEADHRPLQERKAEEQELVMANRLKRVEQPVAEAQRSGAKGRPARPARGRERRAGEPTADPAEPSLRSQATAVTPTAARGASPAVEDYEEDARTDEERPRSSTIPPSTGGTAEPNDQPYGDVFFRSYGVNPFIDTEDDRLSTFGLDVDTGSYTLTRRYLRDGFVPPPEAVRVEELVNFFDYGDRPPAREDFALYAEGAPSPWAPGERYHLLRLAIRARQVSAERRKPAILTFVVDVSGSMGYENRLELVKDALELLLDELGRRDRVALVTYGSRGRVLLTHTSDREAIRRAIRRLAPEGSTNAEEGLVLAYELAEEEARRGFVNRILLCSDGVANVGRTGPGSILQRIGAAARRGIELTTVGFGMGNYNDVLMEQLADRGNGRYAYVDTLAEARRIFVENLTGTLQTIAAEARAQVDFNVGVVSRYRLLGYENRDIPDERFRDDRVDAGEIGAGHAVTALYEIKLRPDADLRSPLATLRLRYRPADGRRFVEVSRRITSEDLWSSWDRASAAFRLAAVVGRFAEVLRGSYWARGDDLQQLLGRARRLRRDFPTDQSVAELVQLIGRARDVRAEGDRR